MDDGEDAGGEGGEDEEEEEEEEGEVFEGAGVVIEGDLEVLGRVGVGFVGVGGGRRGRVVGFGEEGSGRRVV